MPRKHELYRAGIELPIERGKPAPGRRGSDHPAASSRPTARAPGRNPVSQFDIGDSHASQTPDADAQRLVGPSDRDAEFAPDGGSRPRGLGSELNRGSGSNEVPSSVLTPYFDRHPLECRLSYDDVEDQLPFAAYRRAAREAGGVCLAPLDPKREFAEAGRRCRDRQSAH